MQAKLPLAVLLLAGLLVGGYFAAGRLSGASASGGSSAYVLETTIRKVVTVHEHGRTTVKRVPVVVRRVVVRPSTAFQTVVDRQVVTTPGGVRYVVRKVVHYVPVVHSRTVKVNGRTTTVTSTRLVPTVRTQNSYERRHEPEHDHEPEHRRGRSHEHVPARRPPPPS